MSEALLDAIRAASTTIDVPGTPYALRLDHVATVTGGVLLAWSCPDPSTWEPDGEEDQARLRGWVVAEVRAEDVVGAAGSCWARAQLDCARAFQREFDTDGVPGEPRTPRRWDVDQAWQALLDFLGRDGRRRVEVDGHEIRVRSRGDVEVYRIDPAEWAAYISDPAVEGDDAELDQRDERRDVGDTVPMNVPLSGGLPLWVVDELTEAMGAWGPVVGLVDGDIVGLGTSADDDLES